MFALYLADSFVPTRKAIWDRCFSRYVIAAMLVVGKQKIAH